MGSASDSAPPLLISVQVKIGTIKNIQDYIETSNILGLAHDTVLAENESKTRFSLHKKYFTNKARKKRDKKGGRTEGDEWFRHVGGCSGWSTGLRLPV